MEIKEFAIVYDENVSKWRATHNKTLGSKPIYCYGDTPSEALADLTEKLQWDKAEKKTQNQLQKAADVMEKLVDVIHNIDKYGDPLVDLSFKDGDIARINKELLGWYIEDENLNDSELKDATKNTFYGKRFVLYDLDGMEMSFKLKFFDSKQLSNIEIVDHAESYGDYVDKYKSELKKMGLF